MTKLRRVAWSADFRTILPVAQVVDVSLGVLIGRPEKLLAPGMEGHIPPQEYVAQTPCWRVFFANFRPMEREQRASLIDEGRLEEALALQIASLRTDPGNARLHHEKAWLLGGLGRLDEAVSAQAAAVELAPQKPTYRTAMAKLLRKKADWHEGTAKRLEAAKLARWRGLDQRARAFYLRRLEALLERCRRSPHFEGGESMSEAVELCDVHPLDTVEGWAAAKPPLYSAGDVAAIQGVGCFEITNPLDTIQKRLCRGMPWELPSAALVAELASRCKPTSTLVDVGANIGTITMCMARHHRGEVVAFEPFEASYRRLLAHARLNAADNITAIQAACSDRTASGEMRLDANNNDGMARLVPGDGDVSVTTVDVAVDGEVALLKIDVEGHEHEVLSGATETLERDRPIVVCEVLGGSRRAAEVLESAGYQGHKYFRSDWVFVPAELDNS